MIRFAENEGIQVNRFNEWDWDSTYFYPRGYILVNGEFIYIVPKDKLQLSPDRMRDHLSGTNRRLKPHPMYPTDTYRVFTTITKINDTKIQTMDGLEISGYNLCRDILKNDTWFNKTPCYEVNVETFCVSLFTLVESADDLKHTAYISNTPFRGLTKIITDKTFLSELEEAVDLMITKAYYDQFN